jgi:hypothetical protein
MKVGDIIKLDNGDKKLISDSRDEYIPRTGCSWTDGEIIMRTVYRLVGEEYGDWITDEEVEVFSER